MNRQSAVLLVLFICGHTTAKLSAKEKQDIVNYHNDLRNIVSPRASNMVQLEWDDDLAVKAQHWADTCIFGHNPVSSNARWFWIGENIAFSTQKELRGLLKMWENEKEIYDYSTDTCNPTSDPLLQACGHYTQMVWANTKYIGCGLTQECSGSFPMRLVCNYADGGNYNNEKPYKLGPKCSDCPEGYTACSGRLCSKTVFKQKQRGRKCKGI